MAFTVSHTDPALKSALSVVRGHHFYAEGNLHRTMLARWRERLWPHSVTNADHWESETFLHRIAFWIFRRLLNPATNIDLNAIAAKVANGDSSDGSSDGYGPKNALVYMLMCFEVFAPITRKGVTPALPDTFVSQQWNARAIAYEMYLSIKREGGIAWESLQQLFDEMDNRIINDDDVISPIRQIISNARKLPSTLDDIQTDVYDPRFTTSRRKFYSKAQYQVPKTNSGNGGPTKLFPWSNVAENTVTVNVGLSKKMVIFRPNPIQVRHLEGKDVTTPLSTDPSSVKDLPDVDPVVAWRERMVEVFQRVCESRMQEKHDWLERLDGGAKDDYTTHWIGQLL